MPQAPAAMPEPATERGRHRRDRIVQAATEVFLEQGYEAATVAEIGRRAGGSLQTLYRLFGSKEALFRAIIADKAGRVYAPLESADIVDQPPRRALYELGMRLSRLSLSAEGLMLHRIILAESHRNPDLRQMFFETAPGRARDLLADYLRSQVTAGRLQIDDCPMAAMQFLELAKGSFALAALLGDPPDPEDPVVEAGVRQAVAIFLDGTAVTAPGSG